MVEVVAYAPIGSVYRNRNSARSRQQYIHPANCGTGWVAIQDAKAVGRYDRRGVEGRKARGWVGRGLVLVGERRTL